MKMYNKLVRDNIPQICAENGTIAHTRTLKDDKQYLEALCLKLNEEAQEVHDTPNIDELADTLEVLYAIGDTLGYTPSNIEVARKKKAKERGSFNKRIFLIGTNPQN